MRCDTFTSAKARQIKEKLRVPLSTLEGYKLRWAEAVLVGDEPKARKLWEKHRKIALSRYDTRAISYSNDNMRPQMLVLNHEKHQRSKTGYRLNLGELVLQGTPLKAGDVAPYFELPNMLKPIYGFPFRFFRFPSSEMSAQK